LVLSTLKLGLWFEVLIGQINNQK
jgi:hypothetical protein